MDANGVSERRRFTIRCTAKGGVVIEDGNGKKGGSVRSKGGKALSWKNATEQVTCYLRFTLVPDENTDEPVGLAWPFTEDAPPGSLLELPRGAPTTCTLKRTGKTECFEYMVLDADQAPLLDPVIIIDPN